MDHDWLEEEDVLAFDEVEPFIPPTKPSPQRQANPMLPSREPQGPPPGDHSQIPSPLRSVADPHHMAHDLPPYWSRRAINHAQAKPYEAERVPCCSGAMRASLQHYGRRVLCLPCKTIYRFGRPIGHASAASVGMRPRY
ncbi:hypothetical protein [Candidatus Entotheonella palauensis]|nr:hypothetical protein [Candidatus Entotheonella palauensis]